MFIKRITKLMGQILCGILMLLVIDANGNEVSNVMFFSPVIYESVLDAASKDNKLSSRFFIKPSYSLPGKIYFSELLMSDEEKRGYDQSFSLSFSFTPDIKYNIYAKNNCIEKLVRINAKDNQQDIYVRNIQAGELEKLPKEYRELSLRTLSDIYAAEDMFPAFRKQHPNDTVIDFEVLAYLHTDKRSNAISINYPAVALDKAMSIYDNKIGNSSWAVTRDQKSILTFSVSVNKGVDYIPDSHDYICSASVKNNTGDTDFICSLFSSGGLREYVTKKSGKWGLQTVWNENGIQTGTYAFPPGFVSPPLPKKEIPTEYEPDNWFANLRSLGGYSRVFAEYWDAAAKSPCYKYVMGMNHDRIFGEFMFAKQSEQMNALYEKMYKEAQADAAGKNLKVESPVISIQKIAGDNKPLISIQETAIGSKSFCYPEGEITFLRDNMVVKLRSLKKTKDIRPLALEFDRAWLSWHEAQKQEGIHAISPKKGTHHKVSDNKSSNNKSSDNAFVESYLLHQVLGSQAEASENESFEVLKASSIAYSKAKYQKDDYADIDYQRQLFSKPFEKWMESPNPSEKDSFIYKMFYDRQTNGTATTMMHKYIQNETNPIIKRQILFNLLLKSISVKAPDFIRNRPDYFLKYFSARKYYDEESKQIVKDLILKDGCSRKALFLIDVAGIYDDPEISKFLQKNASKCKDWEINNEWYALLILAHNGDKDAVNKVLEIAKKPVQSDRRREQVHGMPLQLAYIHQPEIVELLKEFLPSKESYWFGQDAVPQALSLSHSSARALSSMIKGYPKVNVWQYTDEQRKSCIEWFDENKTYEFTQDNDFSLY